MKAKIFFLPDDDKRLRAGWRLLVHLVIGLILLFLLGALATFALALTDNTDLGTDVSLIQILFALVVTLSVFLARRFIDRRSFASLGLDRKHHAFSDLLTGIAIPGLLMGAIFLTEWAIGWLHFEAFAWQVEPSQDVAVNTLLMFGAFIVVGWNEELLTRGYWLHNLADGLTLSWGVIISSVLFALLHLGNPNVTIVAIIGLVLAGLFLAYGYVRTRQLWLPIGLHIGWNFFENTIFGFPVSGLDEPGLLRHSVDGPELITGGAFGPEAGLIVVPTIALGTVLIYIYTKGRSKSNEQ